MECMHVHGWDGGNEQANERIGGKSLASVVSSFVRSLVSSLVRSLDLGDGDDGRRGFVKSGGAN